MSKLSKIEWCDFTVNFWWGCHKVSGGCANCYAADMDKRYHAGKHWQGARKNQLETARKKALSIQRRAEKGHFVECFDDAGVRFFRGFMATLHNRVTKEFREAVKVRWPDGGEPDSFKCVSVRPRVFSLSMGDWLDPTVPVEWLLYMLETISLTPGIDWQLVTKRPEFWYGRLRAVLAMAEGHEDSPDVWNVVCESEPNTALGSWLNDWFDRFPRNVWVGASIEDQRSANKRIPELLKIPAAVRFLSCEPLLGMVDLDLGHPKHRSSGSYHATIDWVIAGGESGVNARPMDPLWVMDLFRQCRKARVPFFFKQWGEWCSPSMGEKVVFKDSHCLVDGKRYRFCLLADGAALVRKGKLNTGRLLFGKEHNGFPESGVEDE